MKFFNYLDSHKPLAWVLVLLLLLLVSWLDFVTGFEISFSIFYLVPVSLGAWVIGAGAGLLVSAAAGVTWFFMDAVSGHIYGSASIAYWNSSVRLLFFAITSFSLSKIRSSMDLAREQSILKSEMVSLVSHEVNNALVSISLASTLLREGEEAEIEASRKKFYEILQQTQLKLAQLVKAFLAKARLESGKFKLELQRVELRALALEAISSLSLLAAEKNVAVETQFPERILSVSGDPDALSLVVTNLIGNAIKYTPSAGKVIIRTAAADPGLVELSVIDTGVGISAGELEAIFSGFYRTASGKKQAKGIGIGLKVSHELLEAHGSALKVESAAGSGSRFYFRLPAWG